MILKQGIQLNKANWPKILDHLKQSEKENKINYAYHAGWADGDGTFVGRRYSLKITEENPVYNLANAFSTSVYLTTPEKRKGHGDPLNPRKNVNLTGKRCAYFIDKVMPFLMEKRNQGYKALEIFKMKKEKYSYLEYTYDEFCAYLAGFTEAEGSFFDGFKTKTNEKITKYGWAISNTNKALLCFIQSMIKRFFNIKVHVRIVQKGGKNQKFSRHSTRTVNRKKSYRIEISGKKSLPLVKALYPYLMIPYKKEKCKNLMEHDFKR